MICPICGAVGKQIFQGKIMQKYRVQYYQCPICAFIYTETPYWIEEAYKDSITNVDTGIMSRNVDNVLITNIIMKYFFDRRQTFLDYGGGYGIFTRMMRDLGYNWLWYDKFSENLVARGFEYDGNCKIELVSAFELFEHFENPMKEIEHLFSISKSILFSTLIYDKGFQYKEFGKWWYYVPETGQHISFYSEKTLRYIAERFHVHYYKIDNGMHLFSSYKFNINKFKLVTNSIFFKIMKYLYYGLQRGNGLAVKDMQTILERRKHAEKDWQRKKEKNYI